MRSSILLICLFFSSLLMAEPAKTVFLSSEESVFVQVSPQGTAISFPAPPSKVVLVNPSQFALTPVETDLILTPKVKGAKSALFVYVFGRRFSLKLVTNQAAKQMVVVRDSVELRKGEAPRGKK
ncbi:MAG: hypothetical protein R3A80_04270 [Bdellovibrionota bacterium]